MPFHILTQVRVDGHMEQGEEKSRRVKNGKQRRKMKTCLVAGFLTEHLQSRHYHFLLVIHAITCINTE